MPKYKTKQRSLLLDFLAKHPDEQLSASRIAEALADAEISTSAIYRNLAGLEQEGKLRRIPRPGSQETCYRYADAAPCRGHLHLSCLRCGKTVHVEEGKTDALAQSLASSEGFTLDKADTVLYGICADCGQCTDGASPAHS